MKPTFRRNPPKKRVWETFDVEPNAAADLTNVLRDKLNKLEDEGHNIFSVNLDSYDEGVRAIIVAWRFRTLMTDTRIGD